MRNVTILLTMLVLLVAHIEADLPGSGAAVVAPSSLSNSAKTTPSTSDSQPSPATINNKDRVDDQAAPDAHADTSSAEVEFEIITTTTIGGDSEESPDPDYAQETDIKSIKIIQSSADMWSEVVAHLSKRINAAERAADTDLETDVLLFGLDGIRSAGNVANTATTAASPAARTAEQLEQDKFYDWALKMQFKGLKEWQIARNTLRDLSAKGHERASVQYAWMLLLGGGGGGVGASSGGGGAGSRPKQQSDTHQLAGQLLDAAARDGQAAAHTALAFMYALGVGRNVSQAKALLHYTLGAQGDDPWALMALGYRYWAGVAVPASCERALLMYKRVAVRVAAKVSFSGGNAVHRVRLLDEAENAGASGGYIDNDLIEYYQLLADKGDVQSQVGLGQLHYQGGRGMALDLQKALQYFTPAANAGNAVAMGFLGKIYLEGNDYVKADNATAFKYFTKAAELGNPVGQSGLGIMYLQGKGVPRDTTKAYNYFTQAAEQGWVDGQLQLGNMYFTGTGVKRDFKLANKYFSLASQSGHVLAYYNLGQMHALGLGVIRSCPTAVELFKNVAERGAWNERLMNAHHDYKAYRFEEAFRKYALAAEMGYEVGQSNAAYLLDRPDVPLFDNRYEELVRALQLWGRAAAQGYSAAQVKLGDYYYYGQGTTVDYDAAASHYRMASEQQHNAQAMFNMGYMHEQGLGMERDWHLAKRCYDQAAATSVDAKVPVALALLKLSMMFQVEYLKDFNLLGVGDAWLEVSNHILSNWDLYLISVVTIVCGMFIYLQRPDDGRAAANRVPAAVAAPQRADQQQQQQQAPDAAAAPVDLQDDALLHGDIQ